MSDTIEVPKKEIERLKTLYCRHYDHPDNCHNHLEQGGICNSCWARSWAEWVLDGMKNHEVDKQ